MTTREYRQIKNPEDAKSAFRQQTAIDAESQAIIAEAELAASNGLRDAAPGGTLQFAAEAQANAQNAGVARHRADTLRKLAGLKDADYPWQAFANQLEQKLAQEEEMHIRAVEMQEHPEAYGMSQDVADLNFARADARVSALEDALDGVLAKAHPAAKKSTARSGGDDAKE